MTSQWKQLDRDTVRGIFRSHLLVALDAAAREVFQVTHNEHDPGGTDADLPRLFKALDFQIEVLAERYNVALTDEQTS